jgi:DNA-binding XRE family transcriptional regulator
MRATWGGKQTLGRSRSKHSPRTHGAKRDAGGLAELADLNIRTIQKIESGSLNVLITTVIRIQRGLGCKWDRIVPSAE